MHTAYILCKEFQKRLPLLTKYFGLTNGYFTDETSNTIKGRDVCDIPDVADESVIGFEFQSLNPDDICQLIADYPLQDEHREQITDILTILAYTLERNIDQESAESEYHAQQWREYEKDWLKLRLFLDEVINKHPDGMPLEIKPTKGMIAPLELDNTDNWLLRLIKSKLSDTFGGLSDIAQVKEQLIAHKPKSGAKAISKDYNIIMYGIYEMLHGEQWIDDEPDTPTSLCRLIFDFTRLIGCYPESKLIADDGEFNQKRIRADISNTKRGRLQRYLYEPKISQISVDLDYNINSFDLDKSTSE